MVSLASEFPNDNPALHRGVRWLCLDVTGPAEGIPPPVEVDDGVPSMSVGELITAALEPVIPAARASGIVGVGEGFRDEDADDEVLIVEDLPPLDQAARVEGIEPAAPRAAATTTIAPPAPDDPWTVLVTTLGNVAIGAGSPHVASLLPGLLFDGTLEAVLEEARPLLAEADILRERSVTSRFAAQTRAWRGILRGTSDDFAACGGVMLDEWAADLLARLLGNVARAEPIKRELRARGVAAFGLAYAA